MLKSFTDKHVIAAMIIAPILAVIAYMSVDKMVSEKPHQAIKGQHYPLAAKSNCRYKSGQCTLKNGDVSLTISLTEAQTEGVTLAVTSNQAIQNIHVALAGDNASPPPEPMKAINEEYTEWEVNLDESVSDTSRLHIALAVNDSIYFGETGTEFSEYKTGFTIR